MRNFLASATALIGVGMIGSAPASAEILVTHDPILFWNRTTVTNVIGPPPPFNSPLTQTRIYAMVNIAMHDAVNAALGGPNNFYLSGVTNQGGDTRAAASQAAHDVLAALNPSNAAIYTAALNASLAQVVDPVARANGAATGAAYAAAIIAQRSTDGSTASASYTTTGAPGDWRPTTAGGAPAAPHWGGVDPFLMSSGDQFRPGPPPALDSAEYAAAYNQVKAIGSATSTTRLPDQTDSGLFWDAANGAPWLNIGLAVAEDEDLSTLEFASAFALLTTSLADSLIAGFDAKYEYRLWRPATAIREGGLDGDPEWTSLFPAPLHPSYISTHSALSGAGSTVLSSIFGDDEGFTITIAEATRKFTGLAQAARDGADSRLWGGIHFGFDNEAGLILGQQIGRQALSGRAFNAVPEPATWMTMIAGFALAGGALRRGRIRAVSA